MNFNPQYVNMQFLSPKLTFSTLKQFNKYAFIIDYQIIIIILAALYKYIFIFIVLYILICKFTSDYVMLAYLYFIMSL